jgi:hypothetical protein
MRRISPVLLLSSWALCACSKADPPGGTSTAASTTSAAVAQASAAPVASAAPAAAAAPVAAGSFGGKYDSKAGALYLPDTPDMKKVKWRGDEATTGLGAGDLSVTIDADGRVHGESKGVLGALVIEGQVQGDHVAATLRPTKADDGAFTGVLEGTLKGSAISGTLHMADYNAGVLRDATFQLTGK